MVICARTQEAVAACVERLQRQWAGRVRGTVCDVSRYDQVRSLVDFTLEEFGGLDILVNNAGVGVMGDIAEISPRQWGRGHRDQPDRGLPLLPCGCSGIEKARGRIYPEHRQSGRDTGIRGRLGLQCLQVRPQRLQRGHHAGSAPRQYPGQRHPAGKRQHRVPRASDRSGGRLEADAGGRGPSGGGSAAPPSPVPSQPGGDSPLPPPQEIGRTAMAYWLLKTETFGLRLCRSGSGPGDPLGRGRQQPGPEAPQTDPSWRSSPDLPHRRREDGGGHRGRNQRPLSRSRAGQSPPGGGGGQAQAQAGGTDSACRDQVGPANSRTSTWFGCRAFRSCRWPKLSGTASCRVADNRPGASTEFAPGAP